MIIIICHGSVYTWLECRFATGKHFKNRLKVNMGNRDNEFKKRESLPKPAVDVLEGMLEGSKTPLGEDFKRYRLKLDWQTVVGIVIGSKCSPVAYSNGILYIWVVNASWLNQLFFVRAEILKKVNAHAGKGWAKDIRFTQDKKDVPPESSFS